MKKVVLATVIAVLGLTNVAAQEIKFGAKGGLNFASISGDNTAGKETVTAFNFGLLAEIPMTENFSFQPEVMFSGQGYSFNDQTISLNYLNIPMIGKYYVTKGFSLEAGPQISFLLSAKSDQTNVKNLYNAVDYGINFGVGYKLDNGLNFGARYMMGLADINNVDGLSYKNRNVGLQITVGYFFF